MEKYIYLASIIDGEGSIKIDRSRSSNSYHYLLVISIGNTNPMLTEWLRAHFGGKTYISIRSNPHKDLYIWRLNGEKAYSLLKTVNPFLFLKKQQSEVGTKFFEYSDLYTHKKPRPQSLIEKQTYYWTLMRELNKKGKGRELNTNYKKRSNLSEHKDKLIYLAGIIDGEGCLRIDKGKQNHFLPVLEISNTDQYLITWLRDNFGGNIRREKRNNKNHKDLYRWALTGRNLKPLLNEFKNYLILKKPQAELLISFFKRCSWGSHKKRPESLLNLQMKYCKLIRKLNAKGK